MGKYEPLAHFLDSRNEDSWTASFAQIEARLGFALPKSAYEHRAWWSNQQGPGHSQKEAWQAAGWQTKEVDLRRRVVRFERIGRLGVRQRNAASDPAGPEMDELWRRAREISGISDPEELERTVLTRFIEREAALALIRMGGSDPNAKAAPRERPWA